VPPLDVTGSVPPPVGPAAALPVVTGDGGDVTGAAALGLVVTGLEPPGLGPAPPGPEAGSLDDPELALVGLVKLLVGLVKPLDDPELSLVGLVKPLDDPELALVGLVKPLVGVVKLLVGLGLPPSEPAEPAELDPPAAPLGDAALPVIGVRPAAVGPVMEPEPPVPEAAAPEPVGLFAEPELTGVVAPDDSAPAAPLAAPAGFATPVDIWITGTGPVEKVPDPVAVTPLSPTTLYTSR
jgi:hypothetical protein